MGRRNMLLSPKNAKPLGWYLFHDLPTLFARHPLWNIDAIINHAQMAMFDFLDPEGIDPHPTYTRPVTDFIDQTSTRPDAKRIFRKWFKVLNQLNLLAYFSILGIDQHKLYPFETKLVRGMNVYCKYQSLYLGLGNEYPRPLAIENVPQLGMELLHTAGLVPLMKDLAKLDGGWYTLDEINQTLGTTHSMSRKLSTAMKHVLSYQHWFRYDHIINIRLGHKSQPTAFQLPHTAFLITPAQSSTPIEGIPIPNMHHLSQGLPASHVLERLGIATQYVI